MQVLEAGALKPLAEHMTGQQFAWLQAFVAGKPAELRQSEAAAVACFLAGCSQQGFKYSPAFYGCLIAHMQVRPLHSHCSPWYIMCHCVYHHSAQASRSDNIWPRCQRRVPSCQDKHEVLGLLNACSLISCTDQFIMRVSSYA